MKLKGELLLSRELVASEVVLLRELLGSTKVDFSKPNKGILPFKLLDNLTGIVVDDSDAFEVENCIRIILESLPSGVMLNGVILCEDEEDPEASYKAYVDNNIVVTRRLNELPPEPEQLLKCPHCQKIFKKTAFQEVIG